VVIGEWWWVLDLNQQSLVTLLYFYKQQTVFFFGEVFFEAADFVGGPEGEAGTDVETVAMIGAVYSSPMEVALG
jgi:hypothetical protein